MNTVKLLNFKNIIANSIFFNLPTFQRSYSQFFKFSAISSKNFSSLGNLNKETINLNLVPPNPLFVPSFGFKVKAKLKRRCKDCYFAREDGRLMILCDTYPRHKQLQKVKREKFYWILTHCCQSKQRPY